MNYKGWFKDTIILWLLGKCNGFIATIFFLYMIGKAFKQNPEEVLGWGLILAIFFALAFFFDTVLFLSHPFLISFAVTFIIALGLIHLGNKAN